MTSNNVSTETFQILYVEIFLNVSQVIERLPMEDRHGSKASKSEANTLRPFAFRHNVQCGKNPVIDALVCPQSKAASWRKSKHGASCVSNPHLDNSALTFRFDFFIFNATCDAHR
jgi:hypothetical protein